ncbi:MAG: hypothetical protein ALAOOOJD_00865 [bacterium]|nr:hypothetical protein [bacterium]
MSKPLTEKQRRFIQTHHSELASGEMAKRLGVEKNLIDRYLAESVLSGKKKNIFTTILLLLPLAALLLLEALLRVFNYGPNLDLIVVKEKNGQKYCALNPEVGKRYFSTGIAAVPELYEETFAYQKPENGYRIFCLGESTTASFPYELNARFHRLLQDRLTTLFPDKTIEVINVGLSAVNSFTVREFADELVDYQPDLFLLYLGHNEFYGAFGVGSTQSFGKNRTVILFNLWLQKFKIFQLLRNTIAALKGNAERSTATAPTQTLMEQVVGNQYLAFGSADYQKAAQSFRENLTDIIKIAQKNRIGILVSTLTSNLKDQAPFHSLFSAQLPREAKTQWENFFQQGLEWEKQKAYESALAAYREAEKLDAAPAKLHFQMGQCYEALQRYPAALAAYQKARDNDALRFRAAGEFNAIIRQAGRDAKAPIIDMEKVFAENSPHGLTGFELISEHLHPNFDGYFLMAKTFCAAMAENNFIAGAADWNRQLDKSDEEYKHFAAVTEFDLSIGAYKIERLTSHWPFATPVIMNIPMPDEALASKLRQLTTTYSQGNISWNEAHYQLASDFAARKLYDRAEQEYHAVLKIIPENYYPYFKIGDLYLTQEKFALAATWLNLALQRHSRSPYVYAKLATVHFHTRAYEKAVANFTAALNLNKVSNEFSPAEIAWAEYYTAVAHLQLGHKGESLKALDEVIRLQPENAPAQQLRALLQSNATVQLQLTP